MIRTTWISKGLVIAVCVWVLGAESARAEGLLLGTGDQGVTIADWSGDGAGACCPLVNAINGVGLDRNTHSGVDGENWEGIGVTGLFGVFDLGTSRAVERIRFWNQNPNDGVAGDWSDRGPAEVDFLVGDNVTGPFTTISGGPVATPQAPGISGPYDTPQDIPVSGSGQYLRLNLGDTTWGGTCCGGFSEVQIFATLPGSAQLSLAVSDAHGNLGDAGKTIDGSGLTGDTHSAAAGDAWLAVGTDDGAGHGTGFITYDLGAVMPIQHARVWNYNATGQTEAGTRTILFETSDDGSTFTPVSYAVAAEQGTGSDGLVSDDYIFAGSQHARYLRLNLTSLDLLDVGLAEVQVFGVPEPSSLVLAGLAAVAWLGLATRRRS